MPAKRRHAHVPWTIDTVTNDDIARIRDAVDAAKPYADFIERYFA